MVIGDAALFDDGYYETIASYIRSYAAERRVVDLGAADGLIGSMLNAKEIVNVDPYPPTSVVAPMVKMGGVEYLKTCALFIFIHLYSSLVDH